MTRQEQVGRVMEKALENLKNQQLKKAYVEKKIADLVECFEKQTGRTVKNKPLFLELEKAK